MVDPFAHAEPMRQPDVQDPTGAIGALIAQAEAASEMTREAGELVGTAESDDGYIRAEVGPLGLQNLVLDPRAMRMASADLAVAVVELTKQANEDLAERRRQLLEDAGLPTGRVDLGEAQARLAELDSLARSGNGDMQTVYERFRHNLLR